MGNLNSPPRFYAYTFTYRAGNIPFVPDDDEKNTRLLNSQKWIGYINEDVYDDIDYVAETFMRPDNMRLIDHVKIKQKLNDWMFNEEIVY